MSTYSSINSITEMDDIAADESIWEEVKEALLANQFFLKDWRSMLKKIGLTPVDITELEYAYYRDSLRVKAETGLDTWRQKYGIGVDGWYEPLRRGLNKVQLKLLSDTVEKIVIAHKKTEDRCTGPGNVMVRSESTSRDQKKNAPSILISVHCVILNKKASIFRRHRRESSAAATERIFVEFFPFLDLPLDQLETAASACAIKPNKIIRLDYHREFCIDAEQYATRVMLLSALARPKRPEEGRIRFTVVSDPLDNDKECEDIGVAYVNFPDIVASREDLVKTNLRVLDKNDETEEIGFMNVSVICLNAASRLGIASF
ncbi:protein fantom-like [Tubulanus polymorphus]|uniref:protein fantom-like n=1 Tax=Tubulanus polymorphus TaxID=672921 RepID=UPI003DA4A29E